MATNLTAHEIRAAVVAGKAKAADICRATLERVERIEPTVHAFLQLTPEHAITQAEKVDAAIAAGKPVGPLAGVPIAVKDNICTTFSHTTAGSRILQNYQSPYDATVVEKLEAAGGIIVGKTNLDEFAMGTTNENSGYFVTKNPWSEAHVPGGSSGGSAAAVASRAVPVALGSDTGGSIRMPASLCGVVGLKPTYGRVSRYGLIAYGSSLDQIGPLATCVTDATVLLGVIAGHDQRDTTSAPDEVPDYAGALGDDKLAERASKLRIGVPQEYFGDGLADEVRAAVESAIETYRQMGATVREISLPHTRYAVPAYYLVATAECSSNLARFDGVHYGHRTKAPEGILDLYSASRDEALGAEVKRRIMLGTFALSSGYHDAYYLRALKVRRLIKQDFDTAFADVNVIACPTSPTTAFRFGEKLEDPLQMYLADIYTLAVNLAGVPALALPCGFGDGGLPIGLQLIGPAGGERTLLQTARLYERATDWHTRTPPVAV